MQQKVSDGKSEVDFDLDTVQAIVRRNGRVVVHLRSGTYVEAEGFTRLTLGPAKQETPEPVESTNVDEEPKPVAASEPPVLKRNPFANRVRNRGSEQRESGNGLSGEHENG